MPAFGEALQPDGDRGRARAHPHVLHGRALAARRAEPAARAVHGEGVPRGRSRHHDDARRRRTRLDHVTSSSGSNASAPSNQIEINVPITRADLGEPVGWKSGTGDLGIGVKHTLRHSLERGAILAVGGELVLPTGDEAKGFGKGTTVLESFVLYGKLLPNDAFVQVQGDRRVSERLRARGRARRSRGLRPDLDRRRAVRPHLDPDDRGARQRASSRAAPHDAVGSRSAAPGLAEQTPACAWCHGIRAPVTDRGNRSDELVFYLLWDWFDGGVLQGLVAASRPY